MIGTTTYIADGALTTSIITFRPDLYKITIEILQGWIPTPTA
jgi:hypothetical protein